jgi:broad specificity phosphatase PhoE
VILRPPLSFITVGDDQALGKDFVANRTMNRTWLLVRHGESTKNVEQRYSSAEGAEPLTVLGRAQADWCGQVCSDFVAQGSFESVHVYAAPTVRALQTAHPIAKSLGARIKQNSCLAPLLATDLSGRLTTDAHLEYTELGSKVHLYRAGLISGHEVPWPGETVAELEERILHFFLTEDIPEKAVTILVGHKSALTAMVIQILQAHAKYPQGYSGYIAFTPGSMVTINHQRSLTFMTPNISPTKDVDESFTTRITH